ncbi:16S rRNA (cytosine967-C5)-methyltransferase [Kineococcus xinjiangensis]|uniref:16S rRNA (Cytosine967-C5)-methyltransferase n=1 Tax=Kineococcus xinjiangensis TaxID=512762 RepID=A0A2S6IPE5_9ACTN|nr:transcription antitermination factor NusB [Kineococcus xinjiangensis]PPK96051.1 16S rRNA (cytosine967-C5)-methyltransferase [Kineococcus xinjiangensis]
MQQDRYTTVDVARQVAFDVLRAVDAEDAYANLVLPKTLRQRRLHGRDAAFATELAYGVLRSRGTYDAILQACLDRPIEQLDPPVRDLLRLGAHQLLALRVPDHAAVATTVALTRVAVGTGAAGLVNAVLRKLPARDLDGWLAEVLPDAAADEDTHLAVRWSHPQWVVRSLREALRAHGQDAAQLPDLLAADNAAPAVALTALPGLCDAAELVATGARPGRWSPTAAVMDGGDPGALPSVRDGRARVQDEGSQLAALLLTAAAVEGADGRWLDLCAGPGGKAAVLAATAAQRGGHLVAVEVSEHRTRLVESSLQAVTRAAAQAGTRPPEVRTADGREVGTEEPGAYDRVLVDAPCTGLGALRRRPEARWRRTPADLGALGPLQRALLTSAVQAVRPGGVVAYVTCSPVLAETRLVVDDVVRAQGKRGLALERLDTAGLLHAVTGAAVPGAAAGTAVQLWPHLHGTDAMHVQLLRRTS